MRIPCRAATLLASFTVALALGTPAQAALQSRYLDGDNTVDAFYDTTLNITWLRDANVNGQMTWDAANSWANSYSIGVYNDGWRLPTMVDTGTPGCNQSYLGTDCGYNVQTTSGGTVYSEMASLWYDTLGNKGYVIPGTPLNVNSGSYVQDGWGLSNVGSFENMQSYGYWLDKDYSSIAGYAWFFNTNDGGQFRLPKGTPFYAMAVHDGDIGSVSAVPEPEQYAMLLAGFGLVGALARRRKNKLA